MINTVYLTRVSGYHDIPQYGRCDLGTVPIGWGPSPSDGHCAERLGTVPDILTIRWLLTYRRRIELATNFVNATLLYSYGRTVVLGVSISLHCTLAAVLGVQQPPRMVPTRIERKVWFFLSRHSLFRTILDNIGVSGCLGVSGYQGIRVSLGLGVSGYLGVVGSKGMRISWGLGVSYVFIAMSMSPQQ